MIALRKSTSPVLELHPLCSTISHDLLLKGILSAKTFQACLGIHVLQCMNAAFLMQA